MSDRSTIIDNDLFSEMLEKLRFHGDPGMHGSFTAPWGLVMVATPGQSPFYVIAEGSCFFEVPGVGEWELQVGDMVLLPQGDAHYLRDAPTSRLVPFSELQVFAPGRGMPTVQGGGGGTLTRIVSGILRFDSSQAFPILKAMDRAFVLRLHEAGRSEGIDPLLSLYCREGQSQEPGNRAATAGLLKLLFIEILRNRLSARAQAQMPCGANPLLLAFEPSLQAAAEAIHFEPQRPWTIAELAGLSGLSRTTFATRFLHVTGTSPLVYLTRVRMHKATDLLERTNDTLEAIAGQVGYGSEAAFSTAFKRELGVSPGAYRKKSTG